MLSLTHLLGFAAVTPQATSSIIKSVQPFEITIGTGATSATATLTSVDTSKAVIFFAGFTTSHTSTALREFMPRAELTNGTTVTAFRDTSSATHTVTVRGTVVEFEATAVSSVQHGTVTIASSTTSNTATITSVDTARAAVFYLGVTNTTSTSSPQTVLPRIDLTNATTVTATRGSSTTAVLTVGYCVVEFAASTVSSIQQRSVTLTSSSASSTDTISSVDTARAMLLYNGVTCSISTLAAYLYALKLTGATQVTLSRTGSSVTSRTVNYTVVEFAAGIVSSVQRDTIAINNATSADATITGVNTARAVCNWTHFSTDGSGADDRMATAKLHDAATVRGQKHAAGSSLSTVGWEVVEFV